MAPGNFDCGTQGACGPVVWAEEPCYCYRGQLGVVNDVYQPLKDEQH